MRHSTRTILAAALLGFVLCSEARARVIFPDHNWTVQIGDRLFGLVGYDSRSSDYDSYTYVICGGIRFQVSMHIYAVTGIVGCLPALAIMGASFWLHRRLKRAS